jgi:hypothetical protein
MFLSFFALWHVNKNLLVKAQKTWRVDSRDDELNKENEKLREEFMSRWSQASSISRSACKALLSSFANWLRSSTQRPLKPSKNAGLSLSVTTSELVTYLQMKFEKRKEFVRAWTSDVRHFGNITTSRCEGGHQKLKDHLINNRHDILDIISRVKQLTDGFINEYRKDHSKWRDRGHLNDPFWLAVC